MLQTRGRGKVVKDCWRYIYTPALSRDQVFLKSQCVINPLAILILVCIVKTSKPHFFCLNRVFFRLWSINFVLLHCNINTAVFLVKIWLILSPNNLLKKQNSHFLQSNFLMFVRILKTLLLDLQASIGGQNRSEFHQEQGTPKAIF